MKKSTTETTLTTRLSNKFKKMKNAFDQETRHIQFFFFYKFPLRLKKNYFSRTACMYLGYVGQNIK